MASSTPPSNDLLALCMAQWPGRDWAWLNIGSDQSTVARQQSASPLVHALPIGSASLARRCLRHNPPDDADVEAAIATVEDTVMPLVRMWPAPSAQTSLLCTAPEMESLLQQLAAPADVTEATAVLLLYPTDAVENWFNRYADTVMGGPLRGLALSQGQIALLIMVRECLHHWGMQTLAVLRGPHLD